MIAPERQRVILAALHAVTPEEREFLRDHILRCGLDQLFPPRQPRPADHFDHDYEGAILARAELNPAFR